MNWSHFDQIVAEQTPFNVLDWILLVLILALLAGAIGWAGWWVIG